MAKEIQGMCNYCGTGCSLIFHQEEDGSVLKVTGNKNYTVSKGKLCPKGFKIMDPINATDRGTDPLVRQADGSRKVVSWDNAISDFKSRIEDIQSKHGKKSVGFISTGQLFTEEFALLGMLRGLMGIEGDGNTRQCMATAVVAYKQAFGFDSPPFCYNDIEESDCVILIGSNMAIAHPIVFDRFKGARTEDKDLIVIDPRCTESAQVADLHVAVKPKRDLILLYTVANELIKRGTALDHDMIENHTQGFDEFKNCVAPFTRDKLEAETEISPEVLDELVSKIESHKRVSFWWTMGINQSHQGVRTAQAIINICLMTGNIGRPGTGPCSMTGQTNAMGSRLYSNTTSLFGGRDFKNVQHRKEVCDILEIEDSMLPDDVTKPYDKLIDGIESGEIKALWIVHTNPLHSWINSNRIKKLFKDKLELLVVQDIFADTATSKEADIYFPAAGIGEKQGVLVNSERRLGASLVAKEITTNALSDFNIFLRIGEKFGWEKTLEKWSTPEKVFQLLRKFSAGMPCDITGIEDYAHLQRLNGIQWPYRKEDAKKQLSAERRLFEDKKFFTPSGKANFLFAEFEAPALEPTEEYPFYFMSGRGSISQFHTMTRTGRSPILAKQYPADKPYIEINLHDGKRLNLLEGERVRVVSPMGEFVAETRLGEKVKPGYTFVPMHFEGSNALIAESFDPFSREPSFKTGAIRIEKI